MSRVRFPSPAPKNQHSIECFFYALNPPTTPAVAFCSTSAPQISCRSSLSHFRAAVSITRRHIAAVLPDPRPSRAAASCSEAAPLTARVLQNLPSASAPLRCAHTLSPDILRNPPRHTRRACRRFCAPISGLSSPPLFSVPFPHTKKPRFLGALFFIFQVPTFSCRTFR